MDRRARFIVDAPTKKLLRNRMQICNVLGQSIGDSSSPLLPENRKVHVVWVGSRLSLMERLTIKLLQFHGHAVNLWSYEPIENVPEGTLLRNAAEVLPRESIFRFTGIPLNIIPNGGIGSMSHWSDQFQIKLLHQEGGLYTQLDVAFLQPLNFTSAYAFIPHNITLDGRVGGIAPYIMKCEKGSAFTEACYADLAHHITAESIGQQDWDCSMRRMTYALQSHLPECVQHFIHPAHLIDLGGLSSGPYFEPTPIDPNTLSIHWSNATHHQHKDSPVVGSVYHQLLVRMGLA